jgi:predicted esterase
MKDATTLQLPRILCLHGGGSNARIFKAQCRVLRAHLADQFNLVFADAPFESEPGPDVTSVYKTFGPFRRWLRSGPHHPYLPSKDVVTAIETALSRAMDDSTRQGASGEWVAVLGFSQGAKMAASLLFRQQLRSSMLGSYSAGSTFRFAILIAGRAPLVLLDPDLLSNTALLQASQFQLEKDPSIEDLECQEHVLRLPTIHIHGLDDPGLHLHRDLYTEYCASARTLVEWDGGHRVPIKTKDVLRVVGATMDVARATDALK